MPKLKKPKKVKKKDQLKHNIANHFIQIGTQYRQKGDIVNAEDNFRKAIDVNPLSYNALYLIGILHAEAGRLDSAKEFLKMCLDVNPSYSFAYNDLGVVQQQQGDIKSATENYKKALELNAKFSEARNNLGVSFQARGDHKRAKECFKAAIDINPYYFDACNNYIFALDLSEDETIESLVQARKNWAKTHEIPLLKEHKPHENDLSIDRKLRIGYVSADFRLHSASFIFGAMITMYDRDKFEVYAYNNSNAKPDSRTVSFKENVTVWRDIFAMKDDKIAEMIREDKIDILVDLSSYSAGSRLLTFARKPAPVQVTAWGYTTSTGLQSMDYFFVDDVIVRPEEKDLYVEEVIYLENCANHYCPEPKPEVTEMPYHKNGHITFGSFNRLAKVSDDAFKTWAEVLRRVPDSKMLFKLNVTDLESSERYIVDKFAGEGIDTTRLVFKGSTPWSEHMEYFNKIDIMLDSFPHSGGLTSVESLCQGTPVVTLSWPTFVGRVSASVLKTLGMSDWVSTTPEEYIEIAVKKANNINELDEINKTLPIKFANSIIGNCDAYVKAVENEYSKMWEKYVTSKTRTTE